MITVLATSLICAGASLAAAAAADSWNISNVETAPGTVSFTVSGPAGAAIPAAGSIAVTADGKSLKAKVDSNATPDARSGRRIAYLVLDVSGSMAGPGIAAARKAAADYAAAIPDDVELGLVTFSESVRVAVPATSDHQQVLKALNSVRPEGDTALYDAVRAALEDVDQEPGVDERRLLILSDGADTSSRATLGQAVAALRSSGVRADVVAFRLPGDKGALDRLSAASKGRTLAAANADNLAGAFRSAAATFAPRLRVTAEVPDDLAGTSASVVVSGVADGEGWETRSLVTFSSLQEQSAESSSSTGGSSISSSWLGPMLLLVFGVLLLTFLGLLNVPVRARERGMKASRIAEAGRYRVGAVALKDHSKTAGEISLGSATSAVNVRALELMDKRLRSSGSRKKVVADLEGAGLRMRPEEWSVLQLCIIIVTGVLVALLTGAVWLLPVGGFLGWLGCRVFLSVRRNRREAKFLEQIPDTLQLLAGSLRAGFSLPQALGTVVREGTEPTASELNRALTETRLGANLEDALDDTARRMNCADLEWVVIAIRISREVGGNLAEVMETTVATMRERSQLRGLVRVLTAEGRLSAWILSGLPFLVGGFLLVSRPGYFDPMTSSLIGVGMLAVGAGLLGLGIFWLTRLVRIEV